MSAESTESIREDENQWLIYQEKPVTAVVGAVEAFLMGIGAHILQRHPDERMRAMGHAGSRISDTRIAHWQGELRGLEPSDLQRRLACHLVEIIAWLSEEGHPYPETALDDIHAALVWIDKRAKAAGVSGPGWYREIVRETTIGRD